MPAVECVAAHVLRALAPRCEHVVESTDDALGAPEREQRRRNRASGIGIRRVEFETDPGGGTIILAGRVYRGGIAIAAQVFRHRGVRHRAGGLALTTEMFAQV